MMSIQIQMYFLSVKFDMNYSRSLRGFVNRCINIYRGSIKYLYNSDIKVIPSKTSVKNKLQMKINLLNIQHNFYRNVNF